MNQTFKYNGNINHSTNDLKGGYTGNNFSVLNVYLNGQLQYVKIQLLNTFKDLHYVAKLGSTAKDYDERQLANSLWIKCYNDHGQYKP